MGSLGLTSSALGMAQPEAGYGIELNLSLVLVGEAEMTLHEIMLL